jgi:hypothetical protein
MIELSDAQIAAARERGRIVMETQPRAASARYDARTNRIVVELLNGATFAFPPRLVQGLENGSPQQLAQVEISPLGLALHWETLDVDFSVAGLLNGIFGTAKWLAGRAGRATSPAKAAAARANGAKGGRPRKGG